jgi:hypothetical protein
MFHVIEIVVRMQQGEGHWMRNIDTDVGMHFTLF